MSKEKNVQQKSLRLSVRNRRRLAMAKMNHLAKTLRGLIALVGFMATLVWAPNTLADETIAVIENDGTMIHADGWVNTEKIVRRFYANHSDAFDFIVIFTTQWHPRPVSEYSVLARNDVTGIGRQVSALSPSWGSAGNLRIGINMREVDFPAYDTSKNNSLYRALVHEIGHTWLVAVGPLPSGTLLGGSQFGDHFSNGLFTSDRCSGIMRDLHWISNPDGTWTQLYFEVVDDCLGKFHPFALYLMGFENPANITQTFQLLHGTFVYLGGGWYYENGVHVADYTQYQVSNQEVVSIDDVISAGGGARSPSYETAPKQFSIAYILLTEQGEQATPAQLAKLQAIAIALPAKWATATSNLSSIVQATGPTLSPANCKDGTAIGDANGDGAFTTADEDIVGAIYAGNEVKPSRICCIDINQNGTISLADWVKAKRIVAGLDPSPGNCPTFP